MRTKSGEQLELFTMPKSEFDAIWEEVERLRLSQDKVRKRLFHEVKELQEQVISLKAENQRLRFRDEKLLWVG